MWEVVKTVKGYDNNKNGWKPWCLPYISKRGERL